MHSKAMCCTATSAWTLPTPWQDVHEHMPKSVTEAHDYVLSKPFPWQQKLLSICSTLSAQLPFRSQMLRLVIVQRWRQQVACGVLAAHFPEFPTDSSSSADEWPSAGPQEPTSSLCACLQMPELLTAEEVRHHWLHGYAAAWLGLEAAEEAGPAKTRSSRRCKPFQQPARVCIRPEGMSVCFQKRPTDRNSHMFSDPLMWRSGHYKRV